MISKSLSTSEKRAALHQEAGKLAEFCQAIYPLLVAHADDWGCMAGDVFTVKHLVDPTSPRKLAEFTIALKAMHNVGLLTWYEVDGKLYLYLSDFNKHQDLKGHTRDGRKRPIPEAPENAPKFALGGKVPPKPPNLPLREEKRTEENLTYTVPENPGTAEGDASEDRRKAENATVSRFIARFCEFYAKHRNGARYFVVREKHIPLLRKLLQVYPPDQLEKLAVVLLTTDDEWIEGTDRGIGILCTKASWLAGKLAEWEAKHGPVQVAS